MLLLQLVNQALLAERPQIMPQVLLLVGQQRNFEAAQLLQQYTMLPLPDATDLIDYHLRAGAPSKNRAWGLLVTAIHKAMERGDTNFVRQLLTEERQKAVLGVRFVKPDLALKKLVNDFLAEVLISVLVCGICLVAVVMFFRSMKW